jgi:hypothetical protein
MKLFALETCTSCSQNDPQITPPGKDDSSGEKFTYDKGEGIKDKIVISGPLSKTLREALNQIFVKKSVIYSEDAPSADSAIDTTIDNLSVAKESQAQDEYIESLFQYARDNPSANVVLSDFDYVSQDSHVKAVENGEPLNQSEQDQAIIPTYVARAENLMDPDVFELLNEKQDINVVVVSGVQEVDNPLEQQEMFDSAKSQGITQPLFQRGPSYVISDNEANSCLTKAAALEKAYEGSNIRLFFGIESFMNELVKYRTQKKVKTP